MANITRNTDIRNFRPTAGDAKHVDQTKMLNTDAGEIDHNEKNEVGKEHIVSHPSFGKLGPNAAR